MSSLLYLPKGKPSSWPKNNTLLRPGYQVQPCVLTPWCITGGRQRQIAADYPRDSLGAVQRGGPGLPGSAGHLDSPGSTHGRSVRLFGCPIKLGGDWKGGAGCGRTVPMLVAGLDRSDLTEAAYCLRTASQLWLEGLLQYIRLAAARFLKAMAASARRSTMFLVLWST